MSKTVILYARVSSEDQARDGYSLPEQLRGLRELAGRLGWHVLEEAVDDGYSRSTLDRPGMGRVRNLVAAGGVDMVLAWKRDRFGAGYLPGLLEEEFGRKGAELRTPDDLGLSGPALVAHSGVMDTFSRIYLLDLVEKTRRGKVGKVREGKVLGSGPAPYGFTYVTDEKGRRVGYKVAPAEMLVVRRLFELVGHRFMSMYAAGRTLESEGHAAPKGGPWRVSVIRNILFRDCYKPHTVEQLKELGVSASVLARIRQDAIYGVSYFGKRRVVGPARGSRQYRNLPREEWIAVPVPDSGIPGEWVDAARRFIADNARPAFGGGGRDHELSGGILVCGACGRNMTTHTSRTRGRVYWYYACPAAIRRTGLNYRRECDFNRMIRAERLEAEVVGLVDGELLTDDKRLEAHVDAAIERERAVLGSPSGVEEALAERLLDIDRRRERLLDLAERRLIADTDLAERLPKLDEEKQAVGSELARLREAGSRIEGMLQAKRALLEMFGTGLMGGVYWFPPRLRRQVYSLLGLRVTLHPNGTLDIEGTFDADLMRLTPEVERWVEGLRDIDARLEEHAHTDPPKDIEEGIDRIERELAALRRRVCEEAATRG